MNLGLNGRRALVLGASRGLGAAIASSLAAEGVQVFAAARSPKGVDAWRGELPAEQAARIVALQVDLADLASVQGLANLLIESGGVDILVNNGGGPPAGAARDQLAAAWESSFRSMASHLFELTARLLPGMAEKGWGRVITVGSSGIQQPIANLALSNGIRAAVQGWSKTLAAEVAAQGITVNMVLPGRIHTDRVDQLDAGAAQRQGKRVEEIAATSRAGIPAGRYGRPEEFANVVTFLASEAASYVTGSSIRVDGGLIRST
ncbi:SDR family oxidoreductase [Stutzerimonas kirkiae]|uniref:3-oxoacyl-ACP reductase n=1 Tax=Stutzerimonas kirkiae TaxID=2211392 RepID=A0A4Q9QYD5_9GAMM|nr:SDR family oxidoreductase [Stutzerimonas kirkiae]TBU90334.1 3-oxoacyl-ACP reductase [Stutzerimonas kirkiae]TBU98005.1 3-oxoacyl-ACP reductase [Stutzerimonas kirkiae]TBV12312.1 3-oxoacyl-ACP reductase [Stutzerimonas kirkiae]TBV13184.1 3-oxoacyl-ACP reductase [Stutzerimonas kirkiae]